MDNLSMIRNKDLESTSGPMGASMRDGGTEESSMELEPTLIVRREQSNMASGRMERESNGTMSSLLS